MSDELNSVLARVEVDDVVNLARKLVQIPSDRDDEGNIANFLADRLRAQGIHVHDETVVAGRPNIIAKIAGRDPSQAPLVLNAHLDGVFQRDGWSRDALEGWIEGDKLYGGAVSVMKGGLAAMVIAIEVAAKSGGLNRELILHAVMHHDTVGLGTKYVLASEGPSVGYGICGEATNMQIQRAHGGAVKFKITITGKTSHISREDEGIDALRAAMAIYAKVPNVKLTHKPNSDLPDLPKMIVGVLNSGFAAGCVPSEATMLGDVRTLPDMNRETVYNDLKKLVDENAVPGCDYQIRITAAQKSFTALTNSKVIGAIERASKRVTGKGARITTDMPVQAFVTDAADMAAIGLDTAVFGPGDWKYVPDEFVSITDLTNAAKIYLATAYELPIR